ncbi:MAG: HAD family phosphatase [Erysipelotrichaceae bacterium]|nr:HAD family phosphatase [Erysipelotrichaceae bacterium]
MYQVLATDLDGTLFYPKRQIKLVNRKNRALLRDFLSVGGRVAMVSSRSGQFLEKTKRKLGLPLDYIGFDGTIISVDGKIVYDRVFDPEKAKELLSYIRKEYGPGLILMSTDDNPQIMTRTKVSKTTNFLYFAYEAVQGAYREPWVRSDQKFYGELSKGKVRKMMILIGISKKKQLLAEKLTKDWSERYPDFEFTWLNQFIEITPKGCSKASGIAFYLDYLRINHDNVVVVGDSGNDIPMFEAYHGASYCMNHAKDSVKAKASHVISRVSDLRSVLCPSVGSTPSEKEG